MERKPQGGVERATRVQLRKLGCSVQSEAMPQPSDLFTRSNLGRSRRELWAKLFDGATDNVGILVYSGFFLAEQHIRRIEQLLGLVAALDPRYSGQSLRPDQTGVVCVLAVLSLIHAVRGDGRLTLQPRLGRGWLRRLP